MTLPPQRPDSTTSTTHLALEAVQYALLAIVSVLIAVVVIATFVRIVRQPVPQQGELPAVTTTVSPAEAREAAATVLDPGA